MAVNPPVVPDTVPPGSSPVITAEDGKTTTEFWGKTILQVLSIVLGLLVTKARIDTATSASVFAVATLVVPGLLEVGYAVARGIRKQNTQG